MKAESGNTVSLWHGTAQAEEREPLNEDARADVCIVGAGIAGLTTAYLLAKEGRRVIVLDDGPIGGGESGRTTAHLTDAIDDRYRELEKLHGAEATRRAGASHRAAIERIAAIVNEEKIDCDFTWCDGYLFPSDQHPEEDLLLEFDAAKQVGVNVDYIRDAPIDAFGSRHAVCFPRQAHFHILKYLAGLARCIERDGGRICTGTHVKSVSGGAPVRIEAESGSTVRASACVVATNSPITDYVVTHAKQAPYRTFAIAARIPKGSVPDALYWDDRDPYTYIRIQPDTTHDWLIVGGEDYKTGQKEDDVERLDRIEAWTRKHFPDVQSVDYRWSGQVLEPFDGLAFIGPNPDGAENVYIATGDSGQGMTHSTMAGMILTDLITGRPNEYAALYDPKRVTIGSASEFARENLNVAAQYMSWVLPGDAPSEDDIPRGEGRVIRHGTHMIAVYRDEDGALHPKSAVCTHLKCIVNWNNLEKSWDCPCHGSRFAPTGEVLNGPAMTGLEDVQTT